MTLTLRTRTRAKSEEKTTKYIDMPSSVSNVLLVVAVDMVRSLPPTEIIRGSRGKGARAKEGRMEVRSLTPFLVPSLEPVDTCEARPKR